MITMLNRLFIIFFIITCSVSIAQESVKLKVLDTVVLNSPKGVLDGHTFITNSTVRDPFNKSFLKIGFGIGQTVDYAIPIFEVNGEEVRALKGDLIFATTTFEFQQALREWIAFYGDFRLITRVGNETEALIAQGVNLSTAFTLGWQARLLKSRKSYLSTFLSLHNVSVTSIDLLAFVNGIIDSGYITPKNKLVKSTPVTKLNSGLRFAYAFNRTFGLQASFELGYGSSLDRTKENEWVTSWGLLFDCDLKPKYSVPIGFLLAYRNSNYDDTQVVDGLPVQFLLGLHYTGRDDFEFGVIINYQTFKESSYDTKLQFINFGTVFKYYF